MKRKVQKTCKMSIKKFFDRLKNKTSALLITLCLALLAVYGVAVALLLVYNKDPNGVIISSLAAGLAFVGTMVLGIVAFKQTKMANSISQAQLKRELITDLVFQKDATISMSELNVRRMFDEFADINYEGIYCSVDPWEKIDYNKRKFLEFAFMFRIDGAPIDKFRPIDIAINKDLSCKNDKIKPYFVQFNILDQRDEALFSFDPSTERYKICLFLNAPKDLLKKIADKGLFVVDITFEVTSIYGTTQEYRASINFEDQKIDIDGLHNGAKPSEYHELRSILIKKGVPKYEQF